MYKADFIFDYSVSNDKMADIHKMFICFLKIKIYK